MPFSESAARKPKSPPAESTNQEAAYMRYLVEKQRPVAIKLIDGNTLHGWIEYYDRNMLRLTRNGQPNLFIYKHQIVYLSEEGS